MAGRIPQQYILLFDFTLSHIIHIVPIDISLFDMTFIKTLFIVPFDIIHFYHITFITP
jgi:hypothetical protein